MTNVLVNGVDPGLVHTGLVSLVFDPDKRAVHMHHFAILGPDVKAVANLIQPLRVGYLVHSSNMHTFIEDYKPRSHFGTDTKMTKAVHDFRPLGRVISNEGSKKIVRRQLMDLLKVWSFPTVTNHQDLRSAARIALLGMLKDDALNELLAQFVKAHLEGDGWDVFSR